MPKSNQHSPAGTNIQKVKKQNQHSQKAPEGQHGVEFAEETDVQSVARKNKQSNQNKSQQ